MNWFNRGFIWLLLVSFGIACIAYGATQAVKHEIIVKWSTATEFQTAGFNLYRAETQQGPYHKVNANIIPASPDPLVGGDYNFRDNEVEPGRVYFYQLEEVELNGKVTRQDPIQVTSPSGNGFARLLVFLGVGLLIISGVGLASSIRGERVPDTQPGVDGNQV